MTWLDTDQDYSLVAPLIALADATGTTLPEYTSEQENLLALAAQDVEVLACRTRFTAEEVEAFTVDQLAALTSATLAQALWRIELEDEWLGPTDLAGVAAAGITFSREVRPRITPAAIEALAYTGLITRSGTVLPDPVPAVPELPWWLWL